MQDGLYVALSSQVALEKRLVTIADNVANANTVGFRATQVKFEDVVTGTGERSVSFASAGDTYMSTNQGPLKQTGNPYDFAVRGDAWFAIDTPAGQVMTRDGRFTMTEAGDLITLEGHRVLDAGGAPIQLNPRAGAPEASADGMLRQDGNPAGAGDTVEVHPGQEAGGHVPHAGLRLLQVGGQPDHRPSRRKRLRHAGIFGTFVSARGSTGGARSVRSHGSAPSR